MSHDIQTELVGNRYELLDKLGEGGMGSVYRALDRLTGQYVALKRVTELADSVDPADMASINNTVEFRLALAREFKVLASLKHPRIINVLDYGFDAYKNPYIAMELLSDHQNLLVASRGNSLHQKLEKLIQLLQAIAYLHRRNILHCDLKPANVLVNSDGELKVLDFGLASTPEEIDDSDEIAGTLNYMAPEIFQGQPVSQASDLYAVGIMAYEILVGHHPFRQYLNRLDRLIQAVLAIEPDLTPLEGLDIEKLDIQQPSPTSENRTQIFDAETATFSQEDIPTPSDDNSKTALFSQSNVDDTKLTSPPSFKTEVDPNSVAGNVWEDVETQTQILDGLWQGASAVSVVGRMLSKLPETRYREAYDAVHDLATAFNLPILLESVAIRESFLQSAKFVGREYELGLLTDALNQITDKDQPKGSAWLVSGESGIGKSRLLDELRSYALVQGVTVLRGQGVSGGGVSYQLWREPLRRMALITEMSSVDASILKDLVPDIDDLLQESVDAPPLVEDAAYKRRLHETVTSLFKRHKQPILLLMEDLQWTIESLDLLKIINGIVDDTPLLIVGSFRSDECPDLPDQLPDMNLIPLERFSEGHIMELSVSMLGEAGKQREIQTLLQRETEGNVFFMIEVVRVLAEEAGQLADVGRTTLPDTVFARGIQHIVQYRVDRVPEQDKELLMLAAIAGRELDIALLQATLQHKLYDKYADIDLDSWLTICANSGVLEKVGTDWHFSHDKVRQIVLESIPDSQLPILHGIVARAMELTYSDELDVWASLLAGHWRKANDAEQEFKYVWLAGNIALHTGAFEEAISSFSRATLLLFEVIHSEYEQIKHRAEFLIKIGEALEHLGDYSDAEERLKEALSLSNKIEDRQGTALALNVLSDVAWHLGDYERALNYCEQALELCHEIDEKQGEARALNRIAIVYMDQGMNYDEAQNLLERSLKLEKIANYKPGIATVTNNLGYMLFAQGKYDEAFGRFQETLKLGRESGERVKIATALMNLGAITGEQRQYPEAIGYTEEALSIMRDTGNRRAESTLLRNLGGLAEYQGNLEQAEEYMQQSLEISRMLGNRQGIAATLTKIGHIARSQNNFDRAFMLYTQALEIALDIDALPVILETIIGVAGAVGDAQLGLILMGFAREHPALFENIRNDSNPIYESLLQRLPEDEAMEAYDKGTSLDLSTIVAMIG